MNTHNTHISISALLFLSLMTLVAPFAYASEPMGQPDWVRHYGGPSRDASQDLCGLPDGSFCVTGWFENQIDWSNPDLQPFVFGLRDIFVARFDPEGHAVWVKSAGSGHCDVPQSVAALPDGTCAATGVYGYATATCVFGIREPNVTRLAGIGMYDIFVAKYAPDGTLLWAKRAGSQDYDSGGDIAMTPDGAVYVTGAGANIFFEKGLENEIAIEGPTFLARYAANGDFEWVKSGAYGAVTALADGSCVVGTSPGLTRYAADGTELWHDDAYASPASSKVVEAAGGNELYLAYRLQSGGSRVARCRFEPDDSLNVLWSLDIAPSVNVASRLSSRPEGSLLVSAGSNLIAVAEGAAWARTAILGSAPTGLLALPGQHYGIVSGTFYSSATLGTTTLDSRGSGDFYLAKVTALEKCVITGDIEGAGDIQFDAPDHAYFTGDEATLTAVNVFPANYEFVGWAGDIAGLTDPVVSFPVYEDMSVTAVFEPIEGAPPLPAATTAGLAALAAALLLAGVRTRRRNTE